MLLDPNAHLCNKKHEGSCFEIKQAERHLPFEINTAGSILALGSSLCQGLEAPWEQQGCAESLKDITPCSKTLVQDVGTGFKLPRCGIKTVGKDRACSRTAPSSAAFTG